MADTSTSPPASLPPDDLTRQLTIVGPAEDRKARHVSVAGNTYTLLVTGEESAGRYCLIDMHVPPGGGLPPHRHDFEEMLTLLEGELEFTFRGAKTRVGAGETVNIPANAPHFFRNVSDKAARMLCVASPPGLEEFVLLAGDPVESRTAPPPLLTEAQRAERQERAKALGPRFRMEPLGL